MHLLDKLRLAMDSSTAGKSRPSLCLCGTIAHGRAVQLFAKVCCSASILSD